MEDYPKTLAEFEARFSSEEACREYLARIRWPRGFRCPRCGCAKAWPVREVRLQCGACGYQASLTAGTVFEKTRKPLTVWFRAIWWLASQRSGASARELQHFLQLGSYQTAWTWLHKLRRAMVRPGRQRLFGTIEAGVSPVRCHPSGQSSTVDDGETLIAIAVEAKGKRGVGRIRLRRVGGRSRVWLEPFVTSCIEVGSTVRTDDPRGFEALGSLGYRHRVTPEGTGAHRVAYVASLLDEWLLAVRRGAAELEHLDAYLDEFTFWYNRRGVQGRGKLFYRLLRQALEVEPVSYGDLVRRPQPVQSGDRSGVS